MMTDRGVPWFERFWPKVKFTPICWEWTGRLCEKGYGRFDKDEDGNDRPHRAHILSYELHFGAVPDGLELDHLCRNRACVRPSHLEALTRAEHSLRRLQPPSPRMFLGRCPRGHILAGDNLYIAPKSGRTACRTCKNDRQRSYMKKRAGKV